MNRTQKFFAGAALPAVLAAGVAVGVAFAQNPNDHHSDNGDTAHMGEMTNSAAMQDHMRAVMSEDGYQRMLDVMGTHSAGMPMSMDDMNVMMDAMQSCLGNGAGMVPGAPGAGGHAEHHPTQAP